MGYLQAGPLRARKTPGWFFVVRRIREEMTKILWRATENSSAWGFRRPASDQVEARQSWCPAGRNSLNLDLEHKPAGREPVIKDSDLCGLGYMLTWLPPLTAVFVSW